MKFKALINLVPLMAIALVIAIIWQQWQASQAARPDYDDPTAPQTPSKPRGFAPQSESGQVKRIADGDTLTLQSGEKIRLCGIDAPEIAHGQTRGQPLAEQAKDKLRSLLASANNQVMVVPIEKDRYGRTVGEVFVEAPTREQPEQELYVNYEMVASGMAYHYERYSGKCDRDMLAQAEQLAQSKHLGVWSGGNYQRPWDYRRQQR